MQELLFKPLSIVYGAITSARNSLFEKNYFHSKDLEMPTISVGNITVGGTGKTPIVARIAEMLFEIGRKSCILTRGYGRENPKQRVVVSDGKTILGESNISGDEPFELANKLLGRSAVIADAKRFDAGIWAKENLKSDAFILDDGFQHRHLNRDLDIVLIDATNPFGNGNLLPTGILREYLDGLKRADLLIITRSNLVSQDEITNIRFEISKHNSNASILLSNTRTRGIRAIAGNVKIEIDQLKSEAKFFAFCGLGNPESFFESLRRENFDLVRTKSFADHYVYQQKDIFEIENSLKQVGFEILLTTEKDATKLRDLKFKLPCYVVEIEAVIDEIEILRDKLGEICSKR